MSNIIPKKTPEQEELEAKQAELAKLKHQLAELELELSTIRGTLYQFNVNYLNALGERFVLIDELKERIARIIAISTDPTDTDRARQNAEAVEEATTQSRATGEEVREYVRPDFERGSFEPTPVLKDLFRKAAKLTHPDLAKDDTDRTRRAKLMAKINTAYESGDTERLQQLMGEAESHGNEVEDEGIGAKLVRMIRQIAAVKKRLERATKEIDDLQSSDPWKLYESYSAGYQKGLDLFETLGTELDDQIEEFQRRLALCHDAARGVDSDDRE